MSALIDLIGAGIRENFKWRTFKHLSFILSVPPSRIFEAGDSIMKPSILFSIRDNSVLVRLEKYSVGKAAFLSSGLASRRLQTAGAWRYRWKWARTIITVSLETFDAITRRHYEYLTKQAWLFRSSSLLLPLPTCTWLSYARAYTWIYENNYYRSKAKGRVERTTISTKPRADCQQRSILNVAEPYGKLHQYNVIVSLYYISMEIFFLLAI